MADARALAGRPARRRAVLTVISGGGFTFETSCLLRQLATDLDIIFLRTPFGGEPGRDGLPNGEVHPVAPFPQLTRPSHLRAIAATWIAFWASVRVLLKRPIDLIVVVGAPHAVPMLLAAR
ncbi:MAG TPA: hypothetical protein VHY34_03390, partial [Caulobacteraceae bacterium]|nr:hypothetical protein [Caulobacteraceae bacterium]